MAVPMHAEACVGFFAPVQTVCEGDYDHEPRYFSYFRKKCARLANKAGGARAPVFVHL